MNFKTEIQALINANNSNDNKSLLNKKYYFPNIANNPAIESSENLMWIKFTFKTISGVTANSRNSAGIVSKDSGPILYFLAPKEMQETITHEWSDSSSIATRLMDFATKAATNFSQIQQVVGGAAKAGNPAMDVVSAATDVGMDIFSGVAAKVLPTEDKGKLTSDSGSPNFYEAANRLEAASMTVISSISSMNPQNRFFKYDVPTVYKDTPKPSYSFIFQLADIGDPGNDILLPIEMLKYLASPKRGKLVVQYALPHICSVEAVWGKDEVKVPLLDIEYAAITAIQSSHSGPYRNGAPIKSELTVTVTNLYPIYTDNQATVNTPNPENLVSVSVSNKDNVKKEKKVIGNQFTYTHIQESYGRTSILGNNKEMAGNIGIGDQFLPEDIKDHYGYSSGKEIPIGNTWSSYNKVINKDTYYNNNSQLGNNKEMAGNIGIGDQFLPEDIINSYNRNLELGNTSETFIKDVNIDTYYNNKKAPLGKSRKSISRFDLEDIEGMYGRIKKSFKI